MHVKASVSARMSLVRLVQYSLVSSTVFLHFTEQINDDDDDEIKYRVCVQKLIGK